MPVISTSFVDAQTLAVTFEVGDKTSSGKIISYTAQAGDEVWDNVLVRNGKQIGFIIGANQDKVHTFDTYKEDIAADFFKTIDGIVKAGLEDSYTITIDGQSYAPSEVFHKAHILESARTTMSWPPSFVTQHTVHIKLNAPLKLGQSIHIDFQNSLLKDIDVKYTPDSIRSDAVHVSQIGFDVQDPLKVAFLSTWKGVDFGADAATSQDYTEYKAGTAFHVINAATGKSVYDGVIELSQGRDQPNNFWQNFQKTDVYKMHFSSVTKAGTYHVTVDGVGKSYDFTIGENVWQEAFKLSAHGLYEQRSGIAHTKEFTDWARPRDHHPADGVIIKQSTATLMDTAEGLNLQSKSSFDALVEGATNVTVNAWGGWHDAADFDRRIQHTEGINDLLTLAEMKPEFAKANSLNIPESKNAIPDLIDEALWGVDFFMRLQHTNGGVGGGIEYEASPKAGETSWTDSNRGFAYAPDAWSSFKYAGSAAKAAYMVMKYDKARGEAYLASAEKAAAWAVKNIPDYAAANSDLLVAQNLAYAELYKASGDETWNKLYLKTTSYGNKTDLQWQDHMTDAAYVYATTKHAGVNKAVQKLGVDDILGLAQFNLDFEAKNGFMTPFNKWGRVSFTAAMTSPQMAADLFTMAHKLTGDEKWQTGMIAAVQFLFGANPMNLSYMTGIGANQLREMFDIDGSVLGQGPRPGITIYGTYDYQEPWTAGWWNSYTGIPNEYLKPAMETFEGWNAVGPITEYTVHDTIASMTKLLGYLASISGKVPTGAVDPEPVDPGAGGGASPVTAGTPGTIPTDASFKSVFSGRTTGDQFKGTAKADLMKTGKGNDFARGGAGNDKLDLGDGDDRGQGGDGNDALLGGNGKDRLDGESGNDVVHGGSGRDVLLGGTGRDTLAGGAGNDLLLGGRNKDVLAGGTGFDAFTYTARNEGGDTITDFSKGDHIVLRGAAFGGLAHGRLNAAQLELSVDGLAHKAGAHLVWDKADHELWFDGNGKASGEAVLIAHLGNDYALTATDITVI